MNVIEIDILLLVAGLAGLIWMRFRSSQNLFQVACQFVGTFWAQYSLVVSWSLGKLVPFISATSIKRGRLKYEYLFIPFVIYVFVFGFYSSLFWNVPDGVSFAYGEGRIYVQLITFLSLALTARSYAFAVSNDDGVILMWKGLMLLGVVHGAAFLYQYVASIFGLPYIGISRAHGLTLDAGSLDVAAFSTEGGVDILRPGGLAGEPKTVSVVFGLVLLVGIVVGLPHNITKLWKRLALIGVVLSLIGFVGAFSTSGFIGFCAIYVALIFLRVVKPQGVFRFVVYLLSFLVVATYVLDSLELPGLAKLLSARTIERVSDGAEIDPPVEMALQVLSNDPMVLLVGTGIGGGSFRIMELMGQVFEYSYSPNIGLVNILFEFGVIGVCLLLLPFCFLIIVSAFTIPGNCNKIKTWNIRFLLVLSLASMVFMLTGSGIPLGFPLAIGSIIGASQYLKATK